MPPVWQMNGVPRQSAIEKGTSICRYWTGRNELIITCVDGLFLGRRLATQLVSKLNEAKVEAAFACTHKLKAGETVRFTQKRVLN